MNKKKDLTIDENFALALQNHKKNNLQIAKNFLRLNISSQFASNDL